MMRSIPIHLSGKPTGNHMQTKEKHLDYFGAHCLAVVCVDSEKQNSCSYEIVNRLRYNFLFIAQLVSILISVGEQTYYQLNQ